MQVGGQVRNYGGHNMEDKVMVNIDLLVREYKEIYDNQKYFIA